MKNRLILVVLLAFVVGFYYKTLQAQEMNQKPQLWYIYQEQINPAKMSQYEETGKEFVSKLKQNNVNTPSMHFYTFASEEMKYMHVFPMDNFAALDNMMNDWNELEQKVGRSTYQKMTSGMQGVVESVNTAIMMEHPDLSYKPENTSMDPNENRFFHEDILYLNPGQDKEAEQIAKEWVDLYKNNHIETGFTVYQAISGQICPF